MRLAKIWQGLRLDVKVIGSTLVLAGLMTLLLGWSAIAAEQRSLRAQIQNQGTSLATAAAMFSIEPLLTLDHTLLNGYVHRLARAQEEIGFVRILDTSGRVVAQSPEQFDPNSPEFFSIRIFRVPVLVEPEDAEPIGAVELGLLTRHADQAAASRVRWLATGSLAIFAILAVALFLLLKKTVTDPVRILDQAAKALGQGDLDSVILLPGGDELGRLALAMDAMRRDIRSSHAAILRQAELERARDAAEAANQAKSTFLAVMSHEIRSPMNGVIGMADLLAASELNGTQRQYVEIILRSGHALLALLNSILDFSKVEAGAMELERTRFYPGEVVAMACEILEATAKGKGLNLIYEIDSALPSCLRGDPLRLRQVLVNLVGNAIKFTPAGWVRVRMERAPEEEGSDPARMTLHFLVQDTGVGVAPDKQDLIFDRFSQADLSTTRKFGGVGLGLTISRQLVELMDGRMWLESPGVNQGSTFHFLARFERCPVASGRRADGSGPQPGAKKSAPVAPMRILVVDDGVDNRILAAHILGKDSHRVEHAVDGKVALERLGGERFDLVLMDVQMPEMDGIEATRIIREGGAGRRVAEIPILGISAGALHEERARGLEVGMDDFLTKPYRASDLLEAVHRLAARIHPPCEEPEG
ncbi:MAG: response regulator [Magnetococcales bacterium]|nr:response regulator [Magnetococcales bacterium]